MNVSPKILLVLASLILSVLIGVSLSARQNGTSRIEDDEGLVIGMSMDTLKEARWQRDRDIFVKRAEELGAKVLVQSANSDDTRQIQQVMSLIAIPVRCIRVLLVTTCWRLCWSRRAMVICITGHGNVTRRCV